MFRRNSTRWLLTVALVAAPLTASHAQASELLLNGGFESGLTGWTSADFLQSPGNPSGFYAQSGTSSALLGETVPAPVAGLSAAMSEGIDPGSHALYQDFVVPTGTTSGTLSFYYYVHNFAQTFYGPDTLDWSGSDLNQRARVDILRTSAATFSVATADVLFSSQTEPGDLLEEGYTLLSADISSILAANAGSTLRLRFAEVDNVERFILGIDGVSISTGAAPTTPVPEPGSMLLLASGLGVVARRVRPAATDRAPR